MIVASEGSTLRQSLVDLIKSVAMVDFCRVTLDTDRRAFDFVPFETPLPVTIHYSRVSTDCCPANLCMDNSLRDRHAR